MSNLNVIGQYMAELLIILLIFKCRKNRLLLIFKGPPSPNRQISELHPINPTVHNFGLRLISVTL